MLTLFDGHSRDCEGASRRDFLKVGALGLAGLTLPDLLALKAHASENGGFVRDKSVVLLFLHGGPSQYETWDPKMTAPQNIRSYTGEVQTRLPGVTFGGTFPRLASRADRMAIVRSFRVGTGNHGQGRQRLLSGINPQNTPMGSIFTRVAGTTNARTGMPNYVWLPPQAGGSQFGRLRGDFNEIMQTGNLSNEYRPFNPSAGRATTVRNRRRASRAPREGLLADMQLQIPQERLVDRRNLLRQLGDLRRGLDEQGTVEEFDQYRQQAFDVIMRGVSQAFDLSRENAQTIARYDTDTTRFRIPQRVLNKQSRNARRIPEFAPYALGRQLLLARRLCEAGCGFVTVTNYGWDMHGNAFGIDDGFPCLGPALDHTVSTFMDDLQQRGLSDKVLLIITGEMGRTPRINNRRGRDHWAGICSLAMAGGGLRMGQVIGQSDNRGGAPATTPITPMNLLGTIMHTMFDVGQLRVARGLPTDLVRLITSAEPIRELVG